MRLAILFPGAFLLASRLVTAAEVALSNGLVAYLPLQEDLRDHSAKPHPVEVSGIVELKDGAAWFPGKEDWLEMPFIAPPSIDNHIVHQDSQLGCRCRGRVVD